MITLLISILLHKIDLGTELCTTHDYRAISGEYCEPTLPYVTARGATQCRLKCSFSARRDLNCSDRSWYNHIGTCSGQCCFERSNWYWTQCELTPTFMHPGGSTRTHSHRVSPIDGTPLATRNRSHRSHYCPDDALCDCWRRQTAQN